MTKSTVFCCKECGCTEYTVKFSEKEQRILIICKKCDKILEKDDEPKEQKEVKKRRKKR